MPVTPLGGLLNDSVKYTQKKIIPLGIGAIVIGLLLFALQFSLARNVGMRTTGMFQQMGMNVEKMEEVAEKMQAGDEQAAEEMARQVEEAMGKLDKDKAGAMMMGVFGRALPGIGLSMVVGLLLSVFASTYYAAVALYPTLTVDGAFKKSLGLVFPMVGLWIWVFLRSFMWIPIAGVILGIILGPRFALAPVLLIRDGKGVFDSAKESYAKTAGYWGKIFGNALLVGICAFIAVAVLSMVLSVLGKGGVAIFLPVLHQLALAFMTVFMTKLAVSILANPMAK